MLLLLVLAVFPLLLFCAEFDSAEDTSELTTISYSSKYGFKSGYPLKVFSEREDKYYVLGDILYAFR